MLVIGLGRVGGQVYRRLKSFGCDLSFYDIMLPGPRRCPEKLLRNSDILTLHTTIKDDQRPILGPSELSMVKDGAYIINTSRMEAIDHEALITHLPRLGGFATDVCNPDFFNMFSWDDNISVTPHTAGYRIEALESTAKYVYDELRRRLNENDE